MTHRIVMIGAGPRGTYCLRRLFLELERHPLSHSLHIDIIEKSGFFGSGVSHSAGLPDFLLLNTVGGQITAFGHDDEQALAEENRQTLWHYLTGKGIEIGPNEYPGRAQHGQYLVDMFEWITSQIPPNVTLERHHTEAFDITRGDDDRLRVALRNDSHLIADEIILLTGHGVSQIKPGSEADSWVKFTQAQQKKGKSTSYVHWAYPLPQSIDHIQSGETVYVIGMGLTAVDIVKAFTRGRGGTFDGDTYIPSGNEPRIILGSRLGLPCMAKVNNQREEKYEAKILTVDKAKAFRQRPGKIDFENEIFPLILEEMAYVYYSILKGEAFAEQWLDAGDAVSREALIADNISTDQRFSWDRLQNPLALLQEAKGKNKPLFDSFDEYIKFVTALMEVDISEAEKGNMTSPLKGSVDAVFRDLRDFLRTVINRGGLTAASHRFLVSVFNRAHNRLAAGPPASAIKELLILTRAGIVSFSGPNPTVTMDEPTGKFILDSDGLDGARRTVDHVLNGRIHSVDSRNDSSQLIRNLFDKGWARHFMNSDDTGTLELGGLDVSEDYQLIDSSGQPLENICAIGIPLEGIYWFNALAADNRSYGNPFTIQQLDGWVETAVSRLRVKD